MSSLTSVEDGAVILIGTAKGGTVAVTSDGLVYTPPKDAIGTDTFTYQITDGTLVSKPATITFT